jgi:hypothetical protein
VTGKITVRLNNAPANMVVNLNGNTGADSLCVFLGNGADTVSVGGTLGGKINGSVTINAGNGADSISLDANNVAGSGVGGNVNISLGTGNDTVNVDDGFNVGNNLTVTGANTFNLSQFGPTNVANNLVLNAVTKTLPDVFKIGAPTSTIGGNVTVSSSQTAATTQILVDGTIAGNLAVLLGNGTNTFEALATSVIHGNATYVGGAGADNILFDRSGAVLRGNLTINAGNGTNTFNAVAGVTLAGTSVSYNGGSGQDSVLFGATAGGARLTAFLGAGNDTFVYNAGALLASDFIDGGPGTNTLSFGAGFTGITWPFFHKNFS